MFVFSSWLVMFLLVASFLFVYRAPTRHNSPLFAVFHFPPSLLRVCAMHACFLRERGGRRALCFFFLLSIYSSRPRNRAGLSPSKNQAFAAVCVEKSGHIGDARAQYITQHCTCVCGALYAVAVGGRDAAAVILTLLFSAAASIKAIRPRERGRPADARPMM